MLVAVGERRMEKNITFKLSVWVLLILFYCLPLRAEELIGEFTDPHKDLIGHLVNQVDGEKFNTLTGEMGYYLTDIFVEGNGLPIEIGRKHRREFGYPYEFHTMSLETPRIEYTHLGDLDYQRRCTKGECGDDYSQPAQGINQCAGLKLFEVGDYHFNQGDVEWLYDQSDLSTAIKLTIADKSIRFFPIESAISKPHRFPSGADYISPDNWYVDCSGTNWIVRSPEGIKYTFSEYEHVYAGTSDGGRISGGQIDQGKVTVYLKRAEDKYGNTLIYSYDSRVENMQIGPAIGSKGSIFNRSFTKKRLKKVSANDGREVNLNYSGSRITSIVSDGQPNRQRLRYTYTNSGSNEGLNRVTREDDTYWQYSYIRRLSNVNSSDSDPASRFNIDLESGVNLASIRTPLGLTLTYAHRALHKLFYADAPSGSGDYSGNHDFDDQNGIVTAGAAYSKPFATALFKRTISGSGMPAGMVWNYEYYKRSSGNKAITFIKGPASSQKLTHRRIDHHHSPDDAIDDSGKLLSTEIFPRSTSFDASSNLAPLKKTTTSWVKRPSLLKTGPIENIWTSSIYHPSTTMRNRAAWWTSYHSTFNVVPGVVKTSLDGVNFTQTFSSFDNFDKPGKLIESGNTGQARDTRFGYFHDNDSTWLIGLPTTERVIGGGPGITRNYNSRGKLKTKSRFGLATRTYSYHDNGQLASVSWNRNGVAIAEIYDNYYRGISRRETDGENHTINRSVNSDGTVLSETDSNGKLTTYQYDELQRVEKVSTPVYAATEITWTSSGKTKTTLQGKSRYRMIEKFDALNRPVESQQRDLKQNGTIRRFTEYDKIGRVSFQSLPHASSNASFNVGMSYAYDELNRVTSVTNTADSSKTKFCYQSSGCGFSSEQVDYGYASRDARGFIGVYNFAGVGNPGNARLIGIRDTTNPSNASPDRLTSIGRNIYGDITSVARGYTLREYRYSSIYPRTIDRVIEPETGTTTYTYLSDGTRESVRTGASGTTLFQHDRVGRLKLVDYPGATPDLSMTYFPGGELESVTTGGGLPDENRWVYDLNAENDLELEQLSVADRQFTLLHGFDDLGNRDQLTYPSGRSLEFANNALGQTNEIPGFVADATYHHNGAVERIKFANGQLLKVAQNNRQLPESLTTSKDDVGLANLGYLYDLNKNIKTITDAFQGSRALGYDGVNRLIEANGPWGSGSIAYDDNDNVLQKTMGAEDLVYDYDLASNRLSEVLDNGSSTHSFSYDVYGNVTSNATNNFVYDDASNLRSSGTNQYQYDGHNRRVIVDKNGDREIYVYSLGGQLMFRYKPGDLHEVDYIYLAGQLIARAEDKPLPGERATTPVITPNGGESINEAEVTISSNQTRSVIHYTLDGSEPSQGGAGVMEYTGPFTIDRTLVVKTFAIREHYQPSEVGSYPVTIRAAKPAFLTAPATYTKSANVAINLMSPPGEIRYTTDGSLPSASSALYAGSISIEQTTIIKALAIVDGMLDSEVATAQYTIRAVPPVFLKSSGTFTNSVTVTLTASSPGSEIYYTKDSSTPTIASSKYSGSITLSRTTTLKAIAVAPGMIASTVSTSGVYTIQAATPAANKSSGTYTHSVKVSLTTSTPGGTIRYTTNGSTPSSSSARYTGAPTFTKKTTLKMRTFKSGMIASGTLTRSYTIKAATPNITYDNNGYTTKVYISGATALSIYYTKDGRTPSWSNYSSRHPSTFKYRGRFEMSTCGISLRIKARAFGGSFVASNVASKTVSPPKKGCSGGGGGR
jgi:hypothetical protein